MAETATLIRRLAAALILALGPAAFAEAGDAFSRHAGRIHSLLPAAGVLIIEEVGANGEEAMVEVAVTAAAIVRVWRDPAQPWQWQEQPTRLHRFAAGTFVVVVGRRDASGVVHASRVEVPKVEPVPQQFVYVR
jgi:hypothetical protein